MLSIGKLGQGQGDYYIDSVASGIEDYYTGTGEAPGRWTGTSAQRLGLHGDVDAAQLRALLEGDHPLTGGPLVTSRRGPGPRVPGFDLTFSAPKSVSLAFGLGDAELSREVRYAHEAAVDAALGYMERHAAVGRRGRGGAQSVLGEGFVAAAFRHRTSRAGDPQLHTHVLVANAVKGPDGRWTALDGRRLYVQAKTAGYLYQAHLRAELTRRLGVQWTPVRRGQAEIDGIPPAVLRAFSRRRAELEARMATRGERGAKAAQIATLDTRQAKDYAVPADGLRSEWHQRARTLGFAAERIDQITRRAEPHLLDPSIAATTRSELLGPEGLTQRRSTFGRREVLQAWAERLQQGADVEVVERLADDLLTDPDAIALAQDAREMTTSDVIRRADGRVVAATAEERRYSTTELLACERDILAAASDGESKDLGVVSSTSVEIALGDHPTLGTDQAIMVRALLAEGDAISVVVGRAGTGKTFALDAARQAWQHEGLDVVGVALARRAARELEDGSGIPATSVAALLHELHELGPTAVLGERQSVLVVDEAGMVGTRQLHQLVAAAAATQTKVVLVGDHHQLPEIDAGGAFRALAQRGHPIELTDNRRQRHAWERDALDLLREGRSGHALELYDQHDRVVVGEDAPGLRTQLVGDWWHAREAGEDAVMIALRRDDVADLNARARVTMTAAGRLGADTLTVGGRDFAVGDEIVCLRNDRRLGVLNGTRGHVAALNLDRREVTIATSHDTHRTLTEAYLAGTAERTGPGLDHGYAITGHKAQGMTTDRTFVLGSDVLYQEWGYVAMSRGREANRLYLVAPGGADRAEYAPGQPAPDARANLVIALARSQAEPLAHDAQLLARVSAMSTPSLREIARTQAPTVDRSRTNERLGRELSRTEALLRRAEAHRAEVERSFRSPGGGGDQLTRARAEEAQARQRHQQLLAARRRAGQALAAVTNSAEKALAKAELVRREDLAVRRALAAPPACLESVLGQPPHALIARRAWNRAAAHVERYRFRHDVHDHERALGTEPTDLRDRADWRTTRRDLERSRVQLARDTERDLGRELG